MKEYTFNISGKTFNVVINSMAGDTANVTVNGVAYQVGIQNTVNTGVQESIQVMAPADQVAPAAQPAPTQAPVQTAPSGAGKAVTSPLPGVIVAVKVNVGDTVKAGQEVAVLEAMKMENSIEATHEGTVTAIHVAQGDSVLEGAAVVTLS